MNNIKELKYIIINYTNKDESYINKICNIIEKVSEEIINFLEIKNFQEKTIINIIPDLIEFRNMYKKDGLFLNQDKEVPEWVCGYACNGIVNILTLEELNKTKSHENENENNIAYLILHEFVHCCHKLLNKDLGYPWLSEGMATTISHQFDNKELKFNSTIDDMTKGCSNYNAYHTMFKYVFDTYGKKYILKLINDKNLLVNDTDKLFDEVNEIYNKQL